MRKGWQVFEEVRRGFGGQRGAWGEHGVAGGTSDESNARFNVKLNCNSFSCHHKQIHDLLIEDVPTGQNRRIGVEHFLKSCIKAADEGCCAALKPSSAWLLLVRK